MLCHSPTQRNCSASKNTATFLSYPPPLDRDVADLNARGTGFALLPCMKRNGLGWKTVTALTLQSLLFLAAPVAYIVIGG